MCNAPLCLLLRPLSALLFQVASKNGRGSKNTILFRENLSESSATQKMSVSNKPVVEEPDSMVRDSFSGNNIIGCNNKK